MPSSSGSAAAARAGGEDTGGRDGRDGSSAGAGGGSGSVLESLPSPTTTTTRTPTDDDDRIPGRCDVCNQPDGSIATGTRKSKRSNRTRHNNMQKCKRCGLTVHELCNGMVPTTTKDPQWICAACTSVTVGRSKERPTECVLCSVGNDAKASQQAPTPHAMHPLYDRFGPNGKQLILPASSSLGRPRRLAWVHTLCAFSVGTNPITRGSVVSCDENGDFVNDGDEDDDGSSGGFLDSDEGEREAEFDDVGGRGGGGGTGEGRTRDGTESSSRRGNGVDGTTSDGGRNDDDDEGDHGAGDGDDGNRDKSSGQNKELTYVHHFVISNEEPWMSRINDCRKIVCFLCRKKDDDSAALRSLRIPVQCAAGDVEQVRRHKRYFAPDTEACTVAMHVGCARWWIGKGKGGGAKVTDGIRRWRVMYSPGQVATSESEEGGGGGGCDAFAECYCNDHAKIIAMFKGGDRSSLSTSTDRSTSRAGPARDRPQASRRTSSASSSSAAAAGTGKRPVERQQDARSASASASASAASTSSSSGSKRARKNWDKIRSSVVGSAGRSRDDTTASSSSRSGAVGAKGTTQQQQAKRRRISASSSAAPIPAPTAAQARSASDERERRRSLEEAIANRTLQPPGRCRDYVDGRYEWRLRRGEVGVPGAAGGRKVGGGGNTSSLPPDEETPWTGTSPLERALVGCCSVPSSGDEEGDGVGASMSPQSTAGGGVAVADGSIQPGREGQFLALAAVHCKTLSDRSLALAIMHRSNLADESRRRMQPQPQEKDDDDVAANGDKEEERPRPQVMANFLSMGGMKLLMDWLDEASTPKHPDGSEPHHASDTGPLLLPILQVLERIPFDVDLVKKLDMGLKLGALSKRLKQVVEKNDSVRRHPAAGGFDISTVRAALKRLKGSWRKKEKEPPTRGHTEKEVFANLFAKMKSQYALLADYEAKDETAPWIQRMIEAKKRAPVNEKIRRARLAEAEEMRKIERMKEARRREAEAKQAQVKQFMQPIRADVHDKEAKLQAELRRNQAKSEQATQRRKNLQRSMEQKRQKRNSSMVEKLKDGKTRRARVRWADEEEGQPLEEVKRIKGRSPEEKERGRGEARGDADRGPDIDGIRRGINRNRTGDTHPAQAKDREADSSNESGDSLDANRDGGTAVAVEDGLASGNEETGAKTQTKKAEGAVVGEATMFDI